MREAGSPGRLTALVAAMAVAAPGIASGQGWLQDGSDSARSGNASGEGPRFGDLAWSVNVPGLSRTRYVHAGLPPLIVGDDLVIAPSDGEGGASAVLRVGLHDLARRELAIVDGEAQRVVSDGERLFVATEASILALRMDGTRLWEMASRGYLLCGPLAVVLGRLYASCVEYTDDAQDGRVLLWVAAFDAATGAEAWRWTKDPMNSAQAGVSGLLPSRASNYPSPVGKASGNSEPFGLTVVPPYVFAITRDYTGLSCAAVVCPVPPENGISFSVFTLDQETGEFLWGRVTSPSRAVRDQDGYYVEDLSRTVFGVPVPTGTPTTVYFKFQRDAIVGLNPATGEATWSFGVGELDALQEDYGGGFGFVAPSTLYATSAQTLYRIDLATNSTAWTFPLNAPETRFERWAPAGIAIAGDTVIARSFRNRGNATVFGEGANVIYAINATTGLLAWRRAFTEVPDGDRSHWQDLDAFAVGSGVVAVAEWTDNLTLIGPSRAAPQPAVSMGSRFPSPGQLVRVDLSGTPAGVLGPATAYRADWGDAAVTDWQPSPVLTHAYAAEGAFAARLSARNSAGQSGTREVVFEVGGVDLQATSLVAAGAGSPWWALLIVVGLVAVGGGGVAALMIARRRRRDGTASGGTGSSSPPAAPSPAAVGGADDPAPTPGVAFLGKYHVKREIGRGAFGTTWLAVHATLNRTVVIKQLNPGWGDVPEIKARFRREAQILAGLDHPNVTRIHDVEERGDSWFLVMEHVGGGDLAALAAREPLPVARAVVIVREMLDALDYIHGHGVIHRDLKPSNVLLSTEGAVKIADFGVARRFDLQSTSFTTPGSPAPGTPLYMAPEQLLGDPGDARSDLYAVGVTFFSLVNRGFYLGGEKPRTADELRHLVFEKEPVVPEGVGAEVGRWFLRAIAKRSADRYPSARAMGDALAEAWRRDAAGRGRE